METEYQPRRKSGRCANGNERDGGALYHAVPDHDPWAKALCGTKPGDRGNGWSEYAGESVTCKRCIKKQERGVGHD